MQYPVVSYGDAAAFVQLQREAGPSAPKQPTVEYRHLSDSDQNALALIEDDLADLLDRFEAEKREYEGRGDESRDALEGRLVRHLHTALNRLPAPVLVDRDFWRYLSTVWLFDFAVWRDGQGKIPGDPSFGCASKGLHQDTIALRMFNRGEISVRAAGDLDPYAIAEIPGSDLWKSHVLRTLLSLSPDVSREFLLAAREGRMPTSVARLTAKRLKRLRTNVLMEVLTPEQAAELVERERLAAEAWVRDQGESA